MQFGKNLAALRKERKLSQRVVAKALGISQALLSHYENGLREPGIDFLIRCAAYYDCTVDALLGMSKAKPVAREKVTPEWEQAVAYLAPLLGGELERYFSLSLLRLLYHEQDSLRRSVADFTLDLCRDELAKAMRGGRFYPEELMPKASREVETVLRGLKRREAAPAGENTEDNEWNN